MPRRTVLTITATALSLSVTLAMPLQAGLQDWLNKLPVPGKQEPAASQPGTLNALSDSDMIAGLKEALDTATGKAVDNLGRQGGFLDNPQVRIPMPEHLSWAEKSLRTLGQDAVADEFIATLNSAAEQAVPAALEQFRSAISAMSIADARGILSGPDDAATQYFRQHSEANLRERFRPIVSDATARAGVTSAYKGMLDKAGFMGGLVNTDSLDLDQYVTDKTLDGLFLVVAEEERRIRTDPLARGSELLQTVFGSLGRR